MEDIYVGRLMTTNPLTVSPETSMADAAATMLDEEVSSVLVTDGTEGLVGILTTTDFVAVVANDEAERDATVESVMTRDLVTVATQDPIDDAADLLIERGIHHLPVVDEAEGLVGILSTTDLTGYVSRIQSPSPS